LSISFFQACGGRNKALEWIEVCHDPSESSSTLSSACFRQNNLNSENLGLKMLHFY